MHRSYPESSFRNRLRFYLDHFNYVKMAVFQFYPQSGTGKPLRIKCGKRGGWGTTVKDFAKNSIIKGKYEMLCCIPLASSFAAKVQGEVFARFHAVVIKCHSIMRN
jgi:hypothetical protein